MLKCTARVQGSCGEGLGDGHLKVGVRECDGPELRFQEPATSKEVLVNEAQYLGLLGTAVSHLKILRLCA